MKKLSLLSALLFTLFISGCVIDEPQPNNQSDNSIHDDSGRIIDDDASRPSPHRRGGMYERGENNSIMYEVIHRGNNNQNSSSDRYRIYRRDDRRRVIMNR